MSDNLNTRATSIWQYLKENKLVCDGAFGTYYSGLYDTKELPEKANDDAPDRVFQIHREYVEAGARLIRTNTFASNSAMLSDDLQKVRDNIKNACKIASEAADEQAFVAGDIGPIPYENISAQARIIQEYIEICKIFIECKVPVIIFETFSCLDDILPALDYVKKNSETFLITQFSVTQFGYSSAGLSARKLFEEACICKNIDATGFNCGVGSGHMQQILSKMNLCTHKYVTALPNAGYPQNVSNRMVFAGNNIEYFTSKISDMVKLGVDITGGCCGTTPDYIRSICKEVNLTGGIRLNKVDVSVNHEVVVENNAFFQRINHAERKLLAVELAPPMGVDDQKLMDAAHMLEKSGVDVLTFPDSPSGRTRADSILMAEKVSRETGMCVMPHLCCRDKNAIAMRSQLLGAHLNCINNFLVITGDPIPSMERQSIKAVFNFDSVGLMHIINDMNEEQFALSPIVYGGAINQNRRNLNVEIERVRKKMAAGASFFLTQPVFTEEGIERIRLIKQETKAKILCGIMPLVSLKNAQFMKNEMTGIEVSDEIISRYQGAETKEEGEAVGIQIAKEVIAKTDTFVDGYYFSFPFNRVYLLNKILH